MFRFLFVFSATSFSSYNPDIAKKRASARGVTPFRWRARRPNQGGVLPRERGFGAKARHTLMMEVHSSSGFSL